MTHPSEHVLDRIASGLPPVPTEQAHVEQCDLCSARLGDIRREAEAVRSLPGYAAGLAAVRRARPAPRWWGFPRLSGSWTSGAFMAAVVAVAIGLVSIQREGPGTDTRTKGRASLFLVADRPDEPTDQPVTRRLVAGESVQLVVKADAPNAGPGRTYALVFLVNQSLDASILWPPKAERSGEVTSARPLSPGFRVTEGDFLLYGVFSTKPLDAGPLLEDLSAQAKACRKTTEPTCLPAPDDAVLPAGEGRARAVFQVESPP